MGLMDKVKDVAGKATEATKQGVAAGKEKVDDVRNQKKIDSLCEEIGKLVLAQRRDEAPEDADAQIDAKIAEIAELEAKIAES